MFLRDLVIMEMIRPIVILCRKIIGLLIFVFICAVIYGMASQP